MEGRRTPIFTAFRHRSGQRAGRITFACHALARRTPEVSGFFLARLDFFRIFFSVIISSLEANQPPPVSSCCCVSLRLFLAGHEAISHHPAHTFTDGSSQCKSSSSLSGRIKFEKKILGYFIEVDYSPRSNRYEGLEMLSW